MRKVHHLVQGSPEWKAHRATPGIFNGSEIAAIMGIDPKTSRSELLRMKALGGEKEFSDYVQKNVIDKGHEYEAIARPQAEELIGDDLSPLVITNTVDGVLLSVSLDGITQGYDTTFEHKSLNQALAAALDAGTLPDEYEPQCEAGLMVSGATRCLFMASKDGDIATVRHYWYESKPALRPRMIAACKQFEIDRINYVHTEVAERPAAAVSIDLPALFVHAKGEITTHNMDAFGRALAEKLAEVRAIALVTDQDFSNAKEAAKKFRETAKAIALSKEAMLSQTETIGEAARKMDAWVKDMNATALQLEKDVEREDLAKKAGIISGAKLAYVEHIKALNERLCGQYMPASAPNFADAIKGKRNYGSMTDAVDAMLANAKVDADMLADRIELNRNSLLIGTENDTSHLFPDFAQVCTKSREDFAALHAMRMQQEAVRKEAEREKIRQEEAARLAAITEKASVVAMTGGNLPIAESESTANPDKGHAAERQSTMPIHVDESTIDDFLRLLPITAPEQKSLRVNILKWEKYRIARAMKAAA